MDGSLLRQDWHSVILRRVGRVLSQHIRDGRTALHVAYMLAQDCYFLATPDQTAALHTWYGGSRTHVVVGLLQDAGALVGINTRALQIVSTGEHSDREHIRLAGVTGAQGAS